MAVYDAFVSYSHTKDKPIAAALQSVVQKLGKPWYRRRALRVFRDDTSLSATPSLWPSIEQALAQSRYLILLASPEAAASQWVSKEVAYWLEHKSPDTLLIALTDGELAWDNAASDFGRREGGPLPLVMTGRFPSEPKWIDLRPYRGGADTRDNRFVEAGADFAAAIHGMPKEDLLSQEVRQQRRALRLAWSAVGTLAVLITLAGWQWWEAESAKRAAIAAEGVATEQKQIAQTQRDLAERNFGIAVQAGEDVVFKLAAGLRNVQGMRVESVRQILNTGRVLMDQLAQAAPDDLRLQRGRVAMLQEFTATYQAVGDIASARAAADEALAISRNVAAANDPADVAGRRGVAVSLESVGNVRLAAGDLAGALAAYEEELEVFRKLATADPDNEIAQRGVSVGLEKTGDVRRALGDAAGALAAFEGSLAIRRKLAAADPDNTHGQSDVNAILDRVGDMRLAAGDRAGALAAYEECLAIMRKLAALDPGNVMWQRSLSVGLFKVGDMRLAAGDRREALAAYDESLAIMRKVIAADPGNGERQGDVSMILGKIGDVWLAVGDRAAALTAYEESLTIMRKLTAAEPGNPGWQRGLALSLGKIGDVRLAADNRVGALDVYEESLAISRKLAAAEPGNLNWQHDLSTVLIKIGDVRYAERDQARALAAYEESLVIRRRLAAVDPSDVEPQIALVWGLFKVATVVDTPRTRTLLPEMIAILERLEGKLPAAQQTWLIRFRELLAKLPPEQAKAR